MAKCTLSVACRPVPSPDFRFCSHFGPAVAGRRMQRPCPSARLLCRRVRAEAGEDSTEPSSRSGTPTPDTDGKSGFGAGKGFGKASSVATQKKESRLLAVDAQPLAKPAVTRRAAPERPLLRTAVEDGADQQTETAIVVTLGLIFVVILLEGLFLATSGFLPEEWDSFALDSVYPAFSPTVGLFLLGASGYGLYKFLGDSTKK